MPTKALYGKHTRRGTVIFVLLIPLVGAPTVSCLLLLTRLAEERVDVRPSEGPFAGKSRIWQVNVLTPTNYTARGRRLLRWYILSLLFQAAAFFTAITLIYAALNSRK
jgi:hypothetical protein